MKKLISLILVFTVFALSFVHVCAAPSELSQAEAVELYESSFYRFMLLRYGISTFRRTVSEEMKEKTKYEMLSLNYFDDVNNKYAVYTHSTDGKEYTSPQEYGIVYYKLVSETEMNYVKMQYNELLSYAHEVFSEEYTVRLFTAKIRDTDESIELYREQEGTGVALGYTDSTLEAQFMPGAITYFYGNPNIEVVDFRANGNTAEMKVIVFKASGGLTPAYAPTTETVTFENTANGWRVSGGSVFDVLLREKEPTYIYERSEFEILSKKAFDTALLLQFGVEFGCECSDDHSSNIELQEMFNHTHFNYNERFIHPNSVYFEYDFEKTYDKAPNGSSYSKSMHYTAIYDYSQRFKTVDDLKNYGEEILSDEMIERSMIWNEESVVIYRYDAETGVLYMLNNCDYWLEKSYSPYHFADFQNVKIYSDTKATATIILAKHLDDGKTPITYHTETIEFTKTSDGWRASGGTMFDVMFGEKDISPNTGDESAATIVIFVALALVTMIIPFTLQKKRRTN